MTTYKSFQKRMTYAPLPEDMCMESIAFYMDVFDAVLISAQWTEQNLLEAIDKRW